MKYWLCFRRELAYLLRHRGARSMLAVSGVAIILVAAASMYWYPHARQHAALAQRVDDARRAVLMQTQADDINRGYQHALRALQTVTEKLAQTASQARLVESIDHVARRARVRIVSQAYEELREQNGYQPLLANLTLLGAYPALRVLTRELPELPAWCVIQEARFETSRDKSADVKAQIRLACYRTPGGRTPKGAAT